MAVVGAVDAGGEGSAIGLMRFDVGLELADACCSTAYELSPEAFRAAGRPK